MEALQSGQQLAFEVRKGGDMDGTIATDISQDDLIK